VGERGLTPHEGTASRADVQFFAPVGRGGRAVRVCAVTSPALNRNDAIVENFMMNMELF
jgi:hypothetical protein